MSLKHPLRRWARPLACCALLGPAVPAPAQPSRVATHVDSVRAARDGSPTFFPVTFTFVNGREVRAYVEDYRTCLLDQVECYERPLDHIPRPPAKALRIERLKRMVVDGHTLESLYRKGKPLKILAENQASPGPLQIFGYAKTKNDMLIPIPLPVGGALFVSTGTHEKYYWYVRSGGGELQEVPRDQKNFVTVMSQLCAQAPTLVAELQRPPTGPTKAERQPRYRVDNAPELISSYNALMAGR